MKRNDKIVLVNQVAGYLTIDVTNAFEKNYSSVALITGLVRIPERLSSGVVVSKVCKYNRRSVITRTLSWVISTIQIWFLLLFKYRNYKICFFTNPPTSYFVLPLLLKRKYGIVVYDLYPDSLKLVGVGDRNPLYKFWAKLNRRYFNKAEKIITLSNGMADGVEQYIQRDRIDIIHNWPSDVYKPITHDNNPFLIELGLQDKFIVLYSGNLGFGYNMHILIDIAELLKDYADIHFIIIGEGGKKNEMMEKAKNMDLSNISFLPYQPEDRLQYTLGCSDIAVISLGDDEFDVSMPSKTYNYISTGAPLMCIGSEKSELASFIREHKNGICKNKRCINEFADFILKVRNNDAYLEELSSNSKLAAKAYTKENANKYIF